MHLIDFKMMFIPIKILFCIADMGRFQNHGQVHQAMLRRHLSFVEQHDKQRCAIHITFHLFASGIIPPTIIGGEKKYLISFESNLTEPSAQ
jgi:hypothetical protein